jgi:hypothetical protein
MRTCEALNFLLLRNEKAGPVARSRRLQDAAMNYCSAGRAEFTPTFCLVN